MEYYSKYDRHRDRKIGAARRRAERFFLYTNAVRHRSAFKHVECYCNFIGTPRSGHTIVGSILNAHPEVVIGHELGAMNYVSSIGMRHPDLSRSAIYWLLLQRERRFGLGKGYKDFGFDYKVPNQWQGRFTRIRIIGDKMGGHASEYLYKTAGLLQKLRDLVGVPIRLIHVVRNPFDNIATISRRHRKTLSDAADMYFFLCKATEAVRSQCDESEVMTIWHERFIESPADHVCQLCRFLGVAAEEDYVRDCASVVFPSPTRSRSRVKWSPELVDEVAQRMKRYSFVDAYTFLD